MWYLPFCKKLFRLYNVPKIHSFCCIWQYFFPDTEKYFACTCHILFIHSSKPNSIPPLHDCKYCCCKYCCYKYWCTNTWDPAFNSFDIYQEMGLFITKVIRYLGINLPKENYAKTFDCVDHNKLWKILRDGHTRPSDLPLEKPVCRSGNNS